MLNFDEKINQPLVFLTKDIERAIGLDDDIENYYIASNKTSFAESISKQRKNVFLIDKDELLSSWKLLRNDKVKDKIDEINGSVVVFKNTKQITRTCDKNGWKLLNPGPKLINKVEQKISQIEWLDGLTELLPDHKIEKCKNIEWSGEKFILQFNRAHTGEGTYLIDSEEKLKQVTEDFPKRPARITEFIDGQVFTLNCVSTKDKTLTSSISYQITGLPPFTNNEYATIGNDWGFADKHLIQKNKTTIEKIGKKIGKKLRNDGFKGLFGIDVIQDKNTDKIYLLEINARQPASTTYESQLQKQKDSSGLTTFQAHLLSLLNKNIEQNIININKGAQIIYRNQKNKNLNTEKALDKLEQEQLDIIEYENKKPNSEKLRIMTKDSLIEQPDKLNTQGKKIANILSK